MKTVPLRRLTSMSYGEALATEVRTDGDIPVFSSGGETGAHDAPNTRAPAIVVGRKGSHGSLWWSDVPAFVIDTAYAIDSSNTSADLRWLFYVIHSANLRGLMSDVGVPGLSREAAYEVSVPNAPQLDEQRRIADFLDDHVSRIDDIISARQQQVDQVDRLAATRALTTVRGGGGYAGAMRASGIGWLGSVPADWPVQTVNSEFSVMLGKMLDDKRQTGQYLVPYLRNTNVQWGQVDTDDIKMMDIEPSELARFTVQPGDLLICEGGQPGRSAMWSGSIEVMAYQKALHRARSRGRSLEEWLHVCLRAAVSARAFSGETQTTIAHLTNEQLKATRFPFPCAADQSRLVKAFDFGVQQDAVATDALNRSIALLAEYKQSLITAAVTGELDVTTASTKLPA